MRDKKARATKVLQHLDVLGDQNVLTKDFFKAAAELTGVDAYADETILTKRIVLDCITVVRNTLAELIDGR